MLLYLGSTTNTTLDLISEETVWYTMFGPLTWYIHLDGDYGYTEGNHARSTIVQHSTVPAVLPEWKVISQTSRK